MVNKQLFTVCLLAIFLTLAPERGEAQPEPMSIGFPAFSDDLNILNSDEPIARFLRLATTAALLVPFDSARSGDGEVLTDYFRANPDYTVWSLRMRTDSQRSDHAPVLGDDIIYSLGRCAQSGVLEGFTAATERVEEPRPGTKERWIDLSVTKLSAEQVQVLMDQIGRCPIIEARSGTLFGSTLGSGANFIGTGLYRVTDFALGKRFELRRSEGVAEANKEVPLQLFLRGFTDGDAALNALRVGGISAFYSSDEAVLAKVVKDETLLIERCVNGPSVVYRRGVSMPCFGRLGIADIKDLG